MTMIYDTAVRRRWMETLADGDEVLVRCKSELLPAKIIRFGRRLVWVTSIQLADGTHLPSPRFDKKTGDGWGTHLALFPVDDSWMLQSPAPARQAG